MRHESAPTYSWLNPAAKSYLISVMLPYLMQTSQAGLAVWFPASSCEQSLECLCLSKTPYCLTLRTIPALQGYVQCPRKGRYPVYPSTVGMVLSPLTTTPCSFLARQYQARVSRPCHRAERGAPEDGPARLLQILTRLAHPSIAGHGLPGASGNPRCGGWRRHRGSRSRWATPPLGTESCLTLANAGDASRRRALPLT